MRKACRLLVYSSAISILKTDGLGEHRLLVVRTSPDICGLLLRVTTAFGLSLPRVRDYIRLTVVLLRCSPL